MTISGDANSVLTVHSGVLNTKIGNDISNSGIFVKNGKLTLDTQGTIRTYARKSILQSPAAIGFSSGIHIVSDTSISPELEVRNGNIFAYGGGGETQEISSDSYGIYLVSCPNGDSGDSAGSVKYTQSGGNVWAQGGNNIDGLKSKVVRGLLLDHSVGLDVGSYITITGGTLTAIAEEDGARSEAISAVNCKMKISGDAVVKLQANGTNSNTSGIDFAIPSNIGSYNASMQVEGGSLTVESNGVAIQMIQENGKYI